MPESTQPPEHQAISNELFTILAEVSPDLLATFEENYEQPSEGPRGCCSRCGSRVFNWERHMAWHKHLSIAIWLLQSWALQHIKETHEA